MVSVCVFAVTDMCRQMLSIVCVLCVVCVWVHVLLHRLDTGETPVKKSEIRIAKATACSGLRDKLMSML